MNKTKPYGAKGICYYSASSNLKFKIIIDEVMTTVGDAIDLSIKITDIYLMITFNRHDNSLVMFYDLIDLNLDIDYEMLYNFIFNLYDNSCICREDPACETK